YVAKICLRLIPVVFLHGHISQLHQHHRSFVVGRQLHTFRRVKVGLSQVVVLSVECQRTLDNVEKGPVCHIKPLRIQGEIQPFLRCFKVPVLHDLCCRLDGPQENIAREKAEPNQDQGHGIPQAYTEGEYDATAKKEGYKCKLEVYINCEHNREN